MSGTKARQRQRLPAKVLVANRGEIALRIIRACREMGIASVAVYSEADRNTLPVLSADEAVCIGPGPARSSYLNAARVLSAAQITKSEAIHPGYGFLSENPDFADAVEQTGFAFVGPSSHTIRLLGDKLTARRLMREAGVPVIPGTVEPLGEVREAARLCEEIGYPVIIKAAAGGGGKGMRIVRSEAELEPSMQACQSEAVRAFDDGRVYVERYISRARHIEVQLLADQHGMVVHLGERDCSTQRRHQKLIEESPAPGVTPEQREQLGAWAVAAARSAGYTSAGTVEFIADDAGHFYFMEMNSRLQVEHPVTEMVTGDDIVQEQLRIAGGLALEIAEEQRTLHGHAIECRVYAEDPEADFQPCPGYITSALFPAGPAVRVDTHIAGRGEVPPFYDPMLAKVIVWAETREEAIGRMDRALGETRIDGVKTTIGFLRALLRNPGFGKGRMTTSMLDGG